MATLMIFTMHNTTPWWSYLARHLDFIDSTVVLSDLRGDGDMSVVSDFYRFMRSGGAPAIALEQLGDAGCEDVILRCRTLRSLPRSLALKMIGGMWQALSKAVLTVRPNLILSFTIDRYVMDLLERIARRHGIVFLEMTASILSNRVMFLRRGELVQLREPEDYEVDEGVRELMAPDFAPTYVKGNDRFTQWHYWRIFWYYELRSAAFNFIRWVRMDPLNLHYLDAQKSLEHKVRFRDYTVLKRLDVNWESSLKLTPKDRRVFLGLQLFPEASLDYWLKDPSLLAYNAVIVELCELLSAARYHMFVKDHPLQFGFRQRKLIEQLFRMRCVTLVPYEISAAHLLSRCSVSVTLTGTTGFQAAMAGLTSVVCAPYYSTPSHFVHFGSYADIQTLPERIARFTPPEPLDATRRTLARRLLSSNVVGDYFSFRGFNPKHTEHRARVEPLLKSLNAYLSGFLREFQDSMPAPGRSK